MQIEQLTCWTFFDSIGAHGRLGAASSSDVGIWDIS